jgi:long-chain acyl-CoA synthetase
MTTADELGRGIQALQLAPPVCEYQNITVKMIGVFSKNRPEWIILDWANILYGGTMVPFYATLGPESIPFILE